MKTGKRLKTEKEMYPLIEQWQNSTKSRKEWCEQHDIAPHVFHYWLQKYREQYNQAPAFIPLQTEKLTTTGNHVIEIHYPNGVYLRLEKPVSPNLLQQYIQLL